MKFIKLRDNPNLINDAADWFEAKWGIPKEEYLACMIPYIENKTNYGWYLCLDNNKIVAGLGVIKNDFHKRKDLFPNICAVYTEEDYRGKGISGKLLNLAVNDLKENNISPVYLVTDHIGFYEKYGFEFLNMVETDEKKMSRIYIHR